MDWILHAVMLIVLPSAKSLFGQIMVEHGKQLAFGYSYELQDS